MCVWVECRVNSCVCVYVCMYICVWEECIWLDLFGFLLLNKFVTLFPLPHSHRMFSFPIQFQFLFRQTKKAQDNQEPVNCLQSLHKKKENKNKKLKNIVSFCLFSHTANAKEQQQQQRAPETNETHKKKISCHSYCAMWIHSPVFTSIQLITRNLNSQYKKKREIISAD